MEISLSKKMIAISPATLADTANLDTLVNSGYRGEESKKGWATEADLLGGIRTDEESLAAMINKPGAVILKAINQDGELIGCVYLEKQLHKLYLGMLTVSPHLQGAGVGRQLLRSAESYAINVGCAKIIMTVISVRAELIAWYERNGYTANGNTKPFPMDDPKFGLPKQHLEFIEMEKSIPAN
jgi:GNAT superfamily N-acetyltransferase